MLSPYRALDLTDDKGFLCGKILADLGAEVIKVEPPTGDPSRNIPPFYHDEPHPEKSLYWFAYNQGKKSITLNLEHPRGRAIFLELVKKADWVIESFPPGRMEELELGYDVLSRVNPGIILTRISPFGQTGPYRDFKGSDLVCIALSGLMYLCGEPDRPPVRISFPQSYLHAAAEAAVGSLMAFYYRQISGEGQVVDVSIQESLLLATFNARPWWEFHRVIVKRQGAKRAGISGGAVQRQTWRCKDGYVTFVILGSATGAQTNKALVQWMEEEGMADEFIKGINWDEFDMATATQEFHDAIEERIQRFFLQHTKEELYEEAMRRRIMLYPVADIKDLAHYPQLEAREFWVQVEHPELGTSITYPGPFLKSSLKPLRVGRRAPLIGEHNEEIYGRLLGFSPKQIEELKQEGVI